MTERQARYETISDAIWEYCATRTMKDISEEAQRLNASLGPNYTPKDVVDEDRQFRERGCFMEMSHPLLGAFRFPGRPFLMSESPFRIDSHAPLLGSANREIYDEMGLDTRELADEGII